MTTSPPHLFQEAPVLWPHRRLACHGRGHLTAEPAAAPGQLDQRRRGSWWQNWCCWCRGYSHRLRQRWLRQHCCCWRCCGCGGRLGYGRRGGGGEAPAFHARGQAGEPGVAAGCGGLGRVPGHAHHVLGHLVRFKEERDGKKGVFVLGRRHTRRERVAKGSALRS